MRQKNFTWRFILLGSLLLSACAKEDVEPVVSTTEVVVDRDIQLAFGTTIAAQEGATTRMSRTNTQADGQFRGIDYLCFIPFAEERKIRTGDTSLLSKVGFFKMDSYKDPVSTQYPEVGTYYDKHTVSNSLYYASKVPVNTRSFLMYGRPSGGGVTDTSANKFAMGSLVVSEVLGSTDNVAASDITFEPDQIYRDNPANNTPYKSDKTTFDNAKTYAQLMVNFMNELAQTDYTDGVKWYEAPAESAEKTLFDQFKHNGLTFTLGNDQLPTMLTNLYANPNMPEALKTAMETMVASNTYKNYISRSNGTFSVKGNWSGFPRTGSLPNGMFVFKWIDYDHQFVLLDAEKSAMSYSQYTALSPQIQDPSTLAFPAQLWYYGNSTIHTRRSELTEEEINYIIKGQNGVVPWTSIDFDEYFDKNVVEPETQAAVIDYPMNYGVSRLEVNAKMTTSSLVHNQQGGGTYQISSGAIQFKGIMVTNQHKAGFDFQPIDYAFNVLYDNNIMNNRPTPAIFTLDTNYFDRNKVNILTLPSYPSEEVYIIAEFYLLKNKLPDEYKTTPLRIGNTNCEIYPNTCFYMLAKLDPTALSEANLNGNPRQVFISDKCTKVNLILNSLDGAYNYVPDVRSPALTLGLEVEFDWQQADPETIWLHDEE